MAAGVGSAGEASCALLKKSTSSGFERISVMVKVFKIANKGDAKAIALNARVL